MKPIIRPKTLKARVKPEIYEAVQELADLTGETKSTIINDLLEGLLPGLQETIHHLHEVEKMNAQAKASLAQALNTRANVLETAVKETMEKAREDIRQHKLPL